MRNTLLYLLLAAALCVTAACSLDDHTPADRDAATKYIAEYLKVQLGEQSMAKVSYPVIVDQAVLVTFTFRAGIDRPEQISHGELAFTMAGTKPGKRPYLKLGIFGDAVDDSEITAEDLQVNLDIDPMRAKHLIALRDELARQELSKQPE